MCGGRVRNPEPPLSYPYSTPATIQQPIVVPPGRLHRQAVPLLLHHPLPPEIIDRPHFERPPGGPRDDQPDVLIRDFRHRMSPQIPERDRLRLKRPGEADHPAVELPGLRLLSRARAGDVAPATFHDRPVRQFHPHQHQQARRSVDRRRPRRDRARRRRLVTPLEVVLLNRRLDRLIEVLVTPYRRAGLPQPIPNPRPDRRLRRHRLPPVRRQCAVLPRSIHRAEPPRLRRRVVRSPHAG